MFFSGSCSRDTLFFDLIFLLLAETGGQSDMAVIFFDIDGTLLNWNKEMPESTVRTLRMLRRYGHEPIICTGRTKVFAELEPSLRDGFDGRLYGCGTNLFYRGEELLLSEIPYDDLRLCMDTLKEADMPFILEGRDYFYSRSEELAKEAYGRYIISSLGDRMLDADEHREELHVNKLIAVLLRRHKDTAPEDIDYVTKKLSSRFQVMNHNNRALEIVPLGFTKATAIEMLCSRIGLDPKDAYAVGDGNNDIEMLRLVGHGIAMGEASPGAKEAASYVTSGVNEHGIYLAMRHFDLI